MLKNVDGTLVTKVNSIEIECLQIFLRLDTATEQLCILSRFKEVVSYVDLLWHALYAIHMTVVMLD